MKKSQQLMCGMLSETILALCRNTLHYQAQFSIQGLLGITLDDDEIFLVDIRETIKKGAKGTTDTSDSAIQSASPQVARSSGEDDPPASHRARRKRKRRRSREQNENSNSENEQTGLPSEDEDVELIKPSCIKKEKVEKEEDGYGVSNCDGSTAALSREVDTVIQQLPNLSYQMSSDISPTSRTILAMPSSSSSEIGQIHFQEDGLHGHMQDAQEYVEGISEYWAAVAREALDSPDKHSKVFKCDVCGRVLSRKDHLTRHMKMHSGENSPREKKYECKLCDKKYADKASLVIHVRVHTGETPFKCQFCGRGFRDRKPLRQHERIHTGEKPYECKFCLKRFTQNGHKIIHERLHTGEKPYSCESCHEAFSSLAHLRNHIKRDMCKGDKTANSDGLNAEALKESNHNQEEENISEFQKEMNQLQKESLKYLQEKCSKSHTLDSQGKQLPATVNKKDNHSKQSSEINIKEEKQ